MSCIVRDAIGGVLYDIMKKYRGKSLRVGLLLVCVLWKYRENSAFGHVPRKHKKRSSCRVEYSVSAAVFAYAARNTNETEPPVAILLIMYIAISQEIYGRAWMCSDSQLDVATLLCFFDDHDIGPP